MRWGWVESFAVPEPVVLFVVALVLRSFFSPPLEARSLTLVVALVGVALSLGGLAVSLWSFYSFPTVGTGHYVEPSQHLVTAGAYGLCRHPIYLGVYLIYGRRAGLPSRGLPAGRQLSVRSEDSLHRTGRVPAGDLGLCRSHLRPIARWPIPSRTSVLCSRHHGISSALRAREHTRSARRLPSDQVLLAGAGGAGGASGTPTRSGGELVVHGRCAHRSGRLRSRTVSRPAAEAPFRWAVRSAWNRPTRCTTESKLRSSWQGSH